MKIALVAPLFESVPPKLYGGTERVVCYLANELVRLGHEVTLFASGDSQTSAHLISPCGKSLRLDPECRDPLVHHFLLMEQVFKCADDFDLIHFHIDYLHFPLSRRSGICNVTTLHGRLDIPDLVPLYAEYNDIPLVSISNSQRTPLHFANWVGTVYHGLPPEQFRFQEQPGEYLAFLGRISPEKGPERAIEIAIRSGLPLKIAAKIDPADQAYFEEHVRHLFSHPLVDYIGEITEDQKSDFLGSAKALLFPINWPEPFGLVMIEAMACGTPVIAFGSGSVPEICIQDETGFIVENCDQAVEAIGRLGALNRHRCRQVFEERFSAERMTRDYVKIYETILRHHDRTCETRDQRSDSKGRELRWTDLHSRQLTLS